MFYLIILIYLCFNVYVKPILSENTYFEKNINHTFTDSLSQNNKLIADLYCTEDVVHIHGLSLFQTNQNVYRLTLDEYLWAADFQIRSDGTFEIKFVKHHCKLMSSSRFCDLLSKPPIRHTRRTRWNQILFETSNINNNTELAYYLLESDQNGEMRSPIYIGATSIIFNAFSKESICHKISNANIPAIRYINLEIDAKLDLLCHQQVAENFLNSHSLLLQPLEIFPMQSIYQKTKHLLLWDEEMGEIIKILSYNVSVYNMLIDLHEIIQSQQRLPKISSTQHLRPVNGMAPVNLTYFKRANPSMNNQIHLIVLDSNQAVYVQLDNSNLQLNFNLLPDFRFPIQTLLGCPQPFCLTFEADDAILLRDCDLVYRLSKPLNEKVRLLLVLMQGQFYHLINIENPRVPRVKNAQHINQLLEKKLDDHQQYLFHYLDAAEYVNELDVAIWFKSGSYTLTHRMNSILEEERPIELDFSLQEPGEQVETAFYMNGYLHLMSERRINRYIWTSMGDEKNFYLNDYIRPAPYNVDTVYMPRSPLVSYVHKGHLYLYKNEYFYVYKGYAQKAGPLSLHEHILKGCDQILVYKNQSFRKSVPALYYIHINGIKNLDDTKTKLVMPADKIETAANYFKNSAKSIFKYSFTSTICQILILFYFK